MLNINDLPVEILHHIIAFCTQRELLLNVAPVCKLWHELAYDPTHWRKLSFDLRKESITSETVQNCFARSRLLRCIEIIEGRVRVSQCSLSVADIFRCCASHCDKVVDIQLCSIFSLDSWMIVELVRCFPNLESLGVRACEQLDHECVRNICDLSCLRKLEISHCTQLTDELLDDLSCHLPQLQSLIINGLIKISDRYEFIFYFINKCLVKFW